MDRTLEAALTAATSDVDVQIDGVDYSSSSTAPEQQGLASAGFAPSASLAGPTGPVQWGNNIPLNGASQTGDNDDITWLGLKNGKMLAIWEHRDVAGGTTTILGQVFGSDG